MAVILVFCEMLNRGSSWLWLFYCFCTIFLLFDCLVQHQYEGFYLSYLYPDLSCLVSVPWRYAHFWRETQRCDSWRDVKWEDWGVVWGGETGNELHFNEQRLFSQRREKKRWGQEREERREEDRDEKERKEVYKNSHF